VFSSALKVVTAPYFSCLSFDYSDLRREVLQSVVFVCLFVRCCVRSLVRMGPSAVVTGGRECGRRLAVVTPIRAPFPFYR